MRRLWAVVIGSVTAFMMVFQAMPALASSSLVNLGQVNSKVYRGGHLDGVDARFAELQALGVKTVVNLDFMLVDDEDLCKRYGMTCLRFPLVLMPGREANFDFALLQEAFRAVRTAIDDDAGNVYIHCYHGSDRTGMLAAALTLHAHHCGGGEPTADRPNLANEVKRKLDEHHFHRAAFPKLYASVLSWVDAPPAWLCAAPLASPQLNATSLPALSPSVAL